jgi:hypothetical protein
MKTLILLAIVLSGCTLNCIRNRTESGTTTIDTSVTETVNPNVEIPAKSNP